MASVISLKKIAQEIDMLGDDWTAYLNRQTSEVCSFPNDEMGQIEEGADADDLSDWRTQFEKMREILEGNDWIRLPNKFDVNEWSIMRDYAQSMEVTSVRDELLNTIHGRGAFRLFKDTLIRLGFRDHWFEFKSQAIEEIVADFLDARGIPYERSSEE